VDRMYTEKVKGEIERGKSEEWAITHMIVRRYWRGETFIMMEEREVELG
jgi:uncharacterized protein with PIN domain